MAPLHESPQKFGLGMTYRVGSSQVDSQAASPGAQQEDKDVRASLEVSHHVPTIRDLRGSIQSHVGVLPVPHVLLHIDNIKQLELLAAPYYLARYSN